MTKIIGLTGGIGSGKSTVAKYMISKNVPVYIADEEAKAIMSNPEVIVKVQELFAENVLLNDLTLDRKKIALIVFNHPEKLTDLNNLIHPLVKEHFLNWLKTHKKEPFVVKEVAILFETNGHKDCFKVILVTAPKNLRIERTIKRDGITKNDVENRIKNQLPEKIKKELSDYIIINKDWNKTQQQTDEILKILNNL
jgi:dephospho-CoA kinase